MLRFVASVKHGQAPAQFLLVPPACALVRASQLNPENQADDRHEQCDQQ
jgi:hypothetical protein